MISEPFPVEVIHIDNEDPGQEHAVPDRHEREMSADYVSVSLEEGTSASLVTVSHVDRSNTPSEPLPRVCQDRVPANANRSTPQGTNDRSSTLVCLKLPIVQAKRKSSRPRRATVDAPEQANRKRGRSRRAIVETPEQAKRKGGRPRRVTVTAPEQAQPLLPTSIQVEPSVEETAVKREGEDIEDMGPMMTRSKRVSCKAAQLCQSA